MQQSGPARRLWGRGSRSGTGLGHERRDGTGLRRFASRHARTACSGWPWPWPRTASRPRTSCSRCWPGRTAAGTGSRETRRRTCGRRCTAQQVTWWRRALRGREVSTAHVPERADSRDAPAQVDPGLASHRDLRGSSESGVPK